MINIIKRISDIQRKESRIELKKIPNEYTRARGRRPISYRPKEHGVADLKSSN
jgi:hypothetical protein